MCEDSVGISFLILRRVATPFAKTTTSARASLDHREFEIGEVLMITIEKETAEQGRVPSVFQPSIAKAGEPLSPLDSDKQNEPAKPSRQVRMEIYSEDELREKQDTLRLFMAGGVVLFVLACIAFCVKLLFGLYF